MDSESYILFICGGRWQLPWFSYLKSKGHRIALVDPYESSACVPFADIHLKLDARDIDGIKEAVARKNLEISLVTSEQTDVSTSVVAELSEYYGTFGNSLAATLLFSNKLENRQFIQREFGSHIPQFIKARTAGEVRNFMQQFGPEIMIKPPDAQSSRGIYHLTDSADANLEPKVLDALSQTPCDYIIAEQFIHGDEITVEGMQVNGKHFTLAISSKKHFRTGIASELRYPAVFPAGFQDQLTDFHNLMVERSGLKNGITHAEYIVNLEKGAFYLVEVACRGGGSLIPSDIVPWVSGVPVYDMYYSIINGNTPELKPLETLRHAILHFFEFPAGRVTEIHGLTEARNLPGVCIADLEFSVGSVLKPACDDRGRQGFAIVFANSDTELRQRLNAVIQAINVSVVNIENAIA